MEPSAIYQSVILSADYMFVKDVQFFITYSHGIRFIASQQQDQKTGMTIQVMNSIKAYYAMWGFNIVNLRAD